jgi:methylthioribose-1-phosphate isomerase
MQSQPEMFESPASPRAYQTAVPNPAKEPTALSSATSLIPNTIVPIRWEDGALFILDQSKLPGATVGLTCQDWREAVAAIRELRVRGAPLIGIVGAYAVALAAERVRASRLPSFRKALERDAAAIAAARPTAVNLAWAVGRVLEAQRSASTVDEAKQRILDEAKRVHAEDLRANLTLSRHGAALVPNGGGVLTHCNTGSLATSGYGTALGIIRMAWEEGKRFKVYHTETRPVLQGARLTAWELARIGIPGTMIVDGAAGLLLARGEVSMVVVGADRIVVNGDTANKIGTYLLALAAKAHGVPFYVAAPMSTVDFSTPNGSMVAIEERGADEVRAWAGVQAAPPDAPVWNPAFDITPAALITGIVTERGVLRPPFEPSLRSAVESSGRDGVS